MGHRSRHGGGAVGEPGGLPGGVPALANFHGEAQLAVAELFAPGAKGGESVLPKVLSVFVRMARGCGAEAWPSLAQLFDYFGFHRADD